MRLVVFYNYYDLSKNLCYTLYQYLLLKKYGLFSEQEAGKATVYSSLDQKKEAEQFEISIKKVQELSDR